MENWRLLAQRSVDGAARVGNFLPKHPIPMKTTFRNCFLVNFSMEPSTLARALPRGLTPDLHNGRAFLSIVIADLEAMRPGFLPKALGSNFTQVVHRAIVRAPNGERGVYFVRSDADAFIMSAAGNLLSNFQFNLANTMWQGLHCLPQVPGSPPRRSSVLAPDSKSEVHFMLEPWEVGRERASIRASYDLSTLSLVMPERSAFKGQSVKEAQKYFVELYAAFASWPTWDHWSAVRIDRSPWNLVSVEHVQDPVYQFMQDSSVFPKGACELDSVFYVHDLDYHWHRIAKYPFRVPPSSLVSPSSSATATSFSSFSDSVSPSQTSLFKQRLSSSLYSATTTATTTTSTTSAAFPPTSSPSSLTDISLLSPATTTTPLSSSHTDNASLSQQQLLERLVAVEQELAKLKRSSLSFSPDFSSSLPSSSSSSDSSSSSASSSTVASSSASSASPSGVYYSSSSSSHPSSSVPDADFFSMPINVESDGTLVKGVTTVFWDGDCPLCQKEIGFYMRQAQKHKCLTIRFYDVSKDVGPLRELGVDMDAAMRRMHVIDGDGVLHTGASAFTAMWAASPSPWPYLAVLTRLPMVPSVMELAYTTFARFRQRAANIVSPNRESSTCEDIPDGMGASCRVPRESKMSNKTP